MRETLEARLIPEYLTLSGNHEDLERRYKEIEPYLRLTKKPNIPVNVSMRDGQLYIEPKLSNPNLRGKLAIISKPDGKKPADITVTLHSFYIEGSINGLPFKIALSKYLSACSPRST